MASGLVGVVPGNAVNHAPLPHWPPVNSHDEKVALLVPLHTNELGLPEGTVAGEATSETSVVEAGTGIAIVEAAQPTPCELR